MSDFTITERTEPFTLEEVLDFIDDTNIGEMDSCELKSRIVDVIQAERNKAIDEAEADLNLLISNFLVPMGIENVCEELSDANWDLDEEDETWCSRNCGVTNSGNCPATNCYKEWIRMKKAGAE